MKRTTAFGLAPALLLVGCIATTTERRTVDDSGPGWYRDGNIENVRETIRRTEGDPGGGAVAGAIIGGLLGRALLGDGGGAFIGAIGGAATGAAASQGGAEDRYFEVFVRFDGGALGRFVYYGPPPWRSGDRVRQTAGGLARLGPPPQSDAPQSWSGGPTQAPPPPPWTPPPPGPYLPNDGQGW